MNMMKLCPLAMFVCGVLISGTQVNKISAQELDLSFLQGGNQLNTKAWAQFNNKYVPGHYLTDISVNDKNQDKHVLDILPQDSNALCLNQGWLEAAGVMIKPEFYQSVFNVKRQCYVLSNEPNTKVEFDFSTQSLAFSIPQAGLKKKAEEHYDWDYGTSALRLNYNFNGSVNENSTDIYASSGATVNVGEWIVNSSMSVTPEKSEMNIASATHAVRMLKSDLTVGKTYGGSALTGGASMLGISLSSNSAMAPNDIGYTPIFTGIAKTNARVSLTQNGSTVYSEMVPPGPFVIDDVNLLNSGDVTMTVTEVNGSKTTKLFPLTVVANMLSPGDYTYDFHVGVRDDGHQDKSMHGLFSAISLGYGFDGFTLGSSLLIHQDYFSGGIEGIGGLGNFGTLSAKTVYMFAKYNKQSRSASKYSFTYAKTFNELTNIQITDTQYTNENYIEFSSFNPWEFTSDSRLKQKNQYTFSVGQRLNSRYGVSISGWQRTYWQQYGRQLGASISISASFDRFSLSLANSYSKAERNSDSYNVSASISVPFEISGKHISSYATVNSGLDGTSSLTTGISSSLTDNIDYSVSAGWTHPDGEPSYSLMSSYQGNKVLGNITVSKYGRNTTGSASIGGSVIILPEQRDIIFSRNTTGTIAIANIKDTAGVKFSQSPYVTNSKGNAVIPVSSYSNNQVTLDGATLPLDTELMSTNKTIVPTDGAVVYMPFQSIKIKRYLLQITDKQGLFVKNGQWAETETGIPLGFITQNGVLFISSIDKPTSINIGTCVISGKNLEDTNKLQEVTCEN